LAHPGGLTPWPVVSLGATGPTTPSLCAPSTSNDRTLPTVLIVAIHLLYAFFLRSAKPWSTT